MLRLSRPQIANVGRKQSAPLQFARRIDCLLATVVSDHGMTHQHQDHETMTGRHQDENTNETPTAVADPLTLVAPPAQRKRAR